MKKSSIIFLVFVVPILLLSSCASLVTPTSYNVAISSTPRDAEITITNKKGEEVFKGLTPATVSLEASRSYMSGEKYEVKIKAAGHETQTRYITSRIEGWYFGNILFGGLIGMLIIDPLTGAMYKLDTKQINVLFNQENEEEKQSDKKLSIIDINTIPEELKKIWCRSIKI